MKRCSLDLLQRFEGDVAGRVDVVRASNAGADSEGRTGTGLDVLCAGRTRACRKQRPDRDQGRAPFQEEAPLAGATSPESSRLCFVKERQPC
jgi:hypothetical protein